ncbi:hypothetical protein DUNSADRAFT_5279 [Dunaliella salina]|uniref:Encoded protein n=1 Tax=Dunaliella salina TaxID=3046 RepID=A0ABQ7GQK8_DUNSA|nr:hypothetical protein DUNSADRAFT_5279 [Dunaliella salina]|eukprot:KAF5836887.1 hypothetical protein DUNSADRAFT_5279 [Dunaliella salina]
MHRMGCTCVRGFPACFRATVFKVWEVCAKLFCSFPPASILACGHSWYSLSHLTFDDGDMGKLLVFCGEHH